MIKPNKNILFLFLFSSWCYCVGVSIFAVDLISVVSFCGFWLSLHGWYHISCCWLQWFNKKCCVFPPRNVWDQKHVILTNILVERPSYNLYTWFRNEKSRIWCSLRPFIMTSLRKCFPNSNPRRTTLPTSSSETPIVNSANEILILEASLLCLLMFVHLMWYKG